MADDLETVDTSIAADERLSGEGKAPAKAPPSFAAAGAAFLAGLSAEQQSAPLADIDDDGGDVADEGTGAEVAAAAISREDGATWKPELARWVDASGKMVAGAAPEGAPAPRPAAAVVPAPAPIAPKAGAPAPAADAGSGAAADKAEKITLPGIADRGEQDLELEIDDPEVAERLRRLAKEGLRANAFREQRAALDTERTQLESVTSAIESDPVGFVIRQMTPARQLDVARAILVEHFDSLIPDIQQLAEDPTARANRRVELRDQMTESAQQAAEVTRARAYATHVVSAIEALVPEDADPAEAREFVGVARGFLAQLAAQGQQVTPDTVKTLLARHLKYAGFAQPAPTARPAAAPAGAVAQPASDKARAIAARAPSIEDATRAAQRVRRVQTQRAAATRVAPAGAGAAPVSVPLLPPEARTDVRTASKALLKRGLPDTWASRSE